jgi:hypothetical protein
MESRMLTSSRFGMKLVHPRIQSPPPLPPEEQGRFCVFFNIAIHRAHPYQRPSQIFLLWSHNRYPNEDIEVTSLNCPFQSREKLDCSDQTFLRLSFRYSKCIPKSHNRPWTYKLLRSAAEHSSTCQCIRLYTICWMYWYRLQIKWDLKEKFKINTRSAAARSVQ